jgi:serine/threonine protein kinase
MQPNRYEIKRELGRGGMGVVHLAFDKLLNRDVAIKSVWLPAGQDLKTWHEVVKRLIREAQAAGSLRR